MQILNPSDFWSSPTDVRMILILVIQCDSVVLQMLAFVYVHKVATLHVWAVMKDEKSAAVFIG